MNLIDLAGLLIVCCVLTWIGLWTLVTTICRRIDDQLRYHRQVLLEHIQSEFKVQEINLTSRLRRP